MPKLGHAGDPGNLYTPLLTQLLQRTCNGWIGVFRQKYVPGPSGIHSFFQLLRPDNDLPGTKLRPIAAVWYFNNRFLIHTKPYYTLFFKKVNKNMGIIFGRMLLFLCRFPVKAKPCRQNPSSTVKINVIISGALRALALMRFFPFLPNLPDCVPNQCYGKADPQHRQGSYVLRRLPNVC